MNPTITQEQAELRVELHVQHGMRGLPGPIRPELQFRDVTPCDDPTDGGPEGRVIAANNYRLHDIPPNRHDACFDQLRNWCTGTGWSVLDDSRPADAFLWLEHPDGFRMTLQANDLGELYLGATSPCVWPTGVPEQT
jgi:hypothetical protein